MLVRVSAVPLPLPTVAVPVCTTIEVASLAPGANTKPFASPSVPSPFIVPVKLPPPARLSVVLRVEVIVPPPETAPLTVSVPLVEQSVPAWMTAPLMVPLPESFTPASTITAATASRLLALIVYGVLPSSCSVPPPVIESGSAPPAVRSSTEEAPITSEPPVSEPPSTSVPPLAMMVPPLVIGACTVPLPVSVAPARDGERGGGESCRPRAAARRCR